MTKLEELARAICRAELMMVYGPEKWRDGEIDIRVGKYWHRHVPTTRAVLRALREPSPAVVAAIGRHLRGNLSDADCGALLGVVVDAILAETPA